MSRGMKVGNAGDTFRSQLTVVWISHWGVVGDEAVRVAGGYFIVGVESQEKDRLGNRKLP